VVPLAVGSEPEPDDEGAPAAGAPAWEPGEDLLRLTRRLSS